MKNVFIVACGKYMDTTYGCPGEWRCLKAAALGEGKFDEAVRVIAFVRCECPGNTLVPNIGMAMKLSEIKPEEIYISSCMLRDPGCPYKTAKEWAKIIEDNFRIPVKMGTHQYS